MKKRQVKVGFISSSGGHWNELMCLKEIIEATDSFFVTEDTSQIEGSKLDNLYLVKQLNRKDSFFIFKFLKIFIDAFKIIIKENPKAIITTGALISFPFILVSKLFRKKVIYIESFARVNDKSLTGKLAYKFSDLFIVQWESMLECYPKAKYCGGIF